MINEEQIKDFNENGVLVYEISTIMKKILNLFSMIYAK